MKKIIAIFIITLSLKSTQAQIANIGSDTLLWLKTNLENRSASHFSGQTFKTVLDSLYQLKAQIIEFTPPRDVQQFSDEKRTGNAANPTYLFVDSLTMYFAAISDGGFVWQQHRNVLDSNFKYNQSNTINTNVKFIRIIFQQSVLYPKYIANSKNGKRWWTPFAEYFWGPYIIQSVKVGEY